MVTFVHGITIKMEMIISKLDWIGSWLHMNGESLSQRHLFQFLPHASDHIPILLRLNPTNKKKRKVFKLERFEQCWLRDENFEDQIRNIWSSHNGPLYTKIPACVSYLTCWGGDRFGDIPKQIRATQGQLYQINKFAHENGVMDRIRELEKNLMTYLRVKRRGGLNVPG